MVEDTRESGLPQLVMLTGETGRGKSYALQAFYDELSKQQAGYWQPGLTPAWPPDSLATLRRERKRITPPQSLRQDGEFASFLWLGVGCSGYADAPRLDPAADLLRQLHRLLFDLVDTELSAVRKRKWIAERLFEGLGQLEPTLGALKFALKTLAEAPKVLRDDDGSVELTERKNTFNALRAYAGVLAKLEIAPTPLIVVIDDATGATEDLLGAISSLIADPSQEGTQGEGTNRYLPEVFDQFPPLPTVFVMSAWDHALFSLSEATPLAHWLDEYERLQLRSETIECREFDRSAARGLLQRWPLGPKEATREKIVTHIYTNNANGLVNPLVLAEHVAAVEERRDPFSGRIEASNAYIDTLSTSPDHHIEERLEELRSRMDGEEAVVLLTMLCSISISAPWGIVDALRVACRASISLQRVQELLGEAGVASGVTSPTAIDPLKEVTVDADLFDYLKRKSDLSASQRDAVSQASAQFFLDWIVSLEPDAMLVPRRKSWNTISGRQMASFARIGMSHLQARGDTVELLARAVLHEPVAISDQVTGPDSALVFAWRISGCPQAVQSSRLLAGCLELGISHSGLACLKAVLNRRVILSTDQSLKPLLAKLRANTGFKSVQATLVHLLCYLGMADEVESVASPAMLAPESLLQFADALTKAGKGREAIQLLATGEDGNSTVALRRAKLVAELDGPKAGIVVIAPYTDGWTAAFLACDLMAQAGLTDERRTLLSRWAGQSPEAACLLAADEMKNGDAEEARRLLSRWRRAYVPAARQLGLLESSAGRYLESLATLAPFLGERRHPPEVVTAIAQVLDDIGRRGLRFRVAGGSQLESFVEESDELHVVGARATTAASRHLVEKVRSELAGGSTAPEIAAVLLSTEVGSGGATYIAQALREQGLDRDIAAVAFHVLSSVPGRTSEGSACLLADLAFAGKLPNANQIADEVLGVFAGSSSPAVRGRRLAVEALRDEVARIDPLLEFSTREQAYALVAIFRMLGGDPMSELKVWRILSEAAASGSDSNFCRLVWIYAASRVLPIRRGLEPVPPDDLDLLDQILPGVPQAGLIRTLEGVLYSYADPVRDTPPLMPYQVISIYETLDIAGRPNRKLENLLVKALSESLRATPPHAEQFLAWTQFSRLAGRVATVLENP